MVKLKDIRQWCEAIAARIPEIKTVMGLSVEANLADRIRAIAESQTPALFYLPPTADGSGRPDAFVEVNQIVLFVLQKYSRRSSLEVLEEVQPVAEYVKAMIIEDADTPCAGLRLQHDTISTMPETENFGNWAGWAIGFTVISE